MLALVHTTPLGLATHARAPHTCHPTPPGAYDTKPGEASPSPGGGDDTIDRPRATHGRHEIVSLLGREYDNRASEWCRLSFLAKRNASHRRTSRLASEQKPTLASSDGFSLLSSFIFLLLFSLSKKWHVPRHFFSLSLTQLKQRQTTGQYISTKHTARFFLSPKPEGQWGSRSFAPFRLRTAGLASLGLGLRTRIARRQPSFLGS